MNKVIEEIQDKTHDECSINFLIGLLLENIQTAFIGRAEDYHANELWLITKGAIVSARNPKVEWTSRSKNFYVKKFVDIEITIEEKE